MVKSGKELRSSDTHTSKGGRGGGKPSSGIRLGPTPSDSCLQSRHLALELQQRDAALTELLSWMKWSRSGPGDASPPSLSAFTEAHCTDTNLKTCLLGEERSSRLLPQVLWPARPTSISPGTSQSDPPRQPSLQTRESPFLRSCEG